MRGSRTNRTLDWGCTCCSSGLARACAGQARWKGPTAGSVCCGACARRGAGGGRLGSGTVGKGDEQNAGEAERGAHHRGMVDGGVCECVYVIALVIVKRRSVL